jgi:hypothetical protein
MKVMYAIVSGIILTAGMAAAQDFTSTIGRSQEVPAIPEPGGTATMTLNEDGTELTYDISVRGIPEVSAAHFHNAPAGENGGVASPLDGSIDGDAWVSSGVWSDIPADMADAIRNGEIYINVHTADYGGGEVRGQVLGSGTDFEASLERAQVGPAIPAPGGTASLSLDGGELTYVISVWGLPTIAAAHFHNAPAGENGGVVNPLEGDFDADGIWVSSGVWEVPSDMMDALTSGGIYINVHTPDYGSGEVRGQIIGTGPTAVDAVSWGEVKDQSK